jgi:hypothetical protein
MITRSAARPKALAPRHSRRELATDETQMKHGWELFFICVQSVFHLWLRSLRCCKLQRVIGGHDALLMAAELKRQRRELADDRYFAACGNLVFHPEAPVARID